MKKRKKNAFRKYEQFKMGLKKEKLPPEEYEQRVKEYTRANKL